MQLRDFDLQDAGKRFHRSVGHWHEGVSTDRVSSYSAVNDLGNRGAGLNDSANITWLFFDHRGQFGVDLITVFTNLKDVINVQRQVGRQLRWNAGGRFERRITTHELFEISRNLRHGITFVLSMKNGSNAAPPYIPILHRYPMGD
ncbi:hypothetical protein D3C87_1754320 [compost metagenome]